MALDKGVRRVVTALDETGKAIVLFDGENPHKAVRPVRNTVSRLIWTTAESPAAMDWQSDRAAVETGIAPGRCGTVFRILDLPPITPEVEQQDPHARQHELGAEGAMKGRPPSHPLMHRTKTVDYAIVLAGEIDMLLDDSEVHLKPGDVVVQQGTNHAWVNRGTETCRIAFVLVDADAP
jgi:mannose-6-phosphate isomerase-like protein (cupin superfamily)